MHSQIGAFFFLKSGKKILGVLWMEKKYNMGMCLQDIAYAQKIFWGKLGLKSAIFGLHNIGIDSCTEIRQATLGLHLWYVNFKVCLRVN